MTKCLHPIITVPVSAVDDMRQENGHVIVRIRMDQLQQAFNDADITSFLYAERAVMALDPEGGGSKALTYVNAGFTISLLTEQRRSRPSATTTT